MSRFIKFIIYSILITFFILTVLVIFLSNVGLETKRFNSIITEQVKKYNQELSLDVKKVKIFLSIGLPTNPKLIISSKDPTLILDQKKIQLKFINTKIDIFSYFKDNFILEEFEILTKDNKIKDLISIAALEKPELIAYNLFIKKGYANTYISLNFNQNGKIQNYKLKGKIKKAKIKLNEKYTFENIYFDFNYNEDEIYIKNANLYYKKLKFLSEQISIISEPNKKLIQGNIKNEKTKVNLSLFKNLLENELNYFKDQEIIFESENKFSFNVQKGKIKGVEFSSKIDLENINLSPKNNFLKNYFSNYKNSILLKNNLIELEYKNKNLNIKGESDYSFDNLFDKIQYKIIKKKNTYDFLTLINFDNNPIKIKSINYSKKKNKKSNLKLNGTYNKNKIKFSEIIYKENKNYFNLKNLNLNNNFKIVDIQRIKLDYLNTNNKKNKITLEKKSNYYSLSGTSFDSYDIINNTLFSDNDKNFLDNFNLSDETLLNINLNKIFLDKENFSKNLLGKLIIKNNKVHYLSLSSLFDKGGQFKLEVKTLKNKQKITSFYSDNAEPFVKHYKFIKGFKEGKIDFYSVKKNNVSNSTLNIFDFKVKEMPALTKLLSLASLQGIADLMTGEGIRFNEFEMNFSNNKKLMTIDEIYALGPAISILMSGYVESDKLISLRGTLVPATTLNKVIGSLPLIGNILVGKKTGEGVFGVSFKIKGPPKKLKTTVNPIKTLTPRFITRTLEKAKKQN
tara:strand:+ start:899 stop:3112 length:2214 start_codon:yes stop_codon:yes gene_type:complete